VKYDSIVIGAGMSGMAAAIRMAMFDKKVLLIEKHRISGGLNSYYQRGKRKFDVGLHALTNFVPKGTRGRPLTKILKQLRINYDSLSLSPQTKSLIHFPSNKIFFNNNIALLRSEIEKCFPSELNGFDTLVEDILNFNEVSLDNTYEPTKIKLRSYLSSDLLIEMLMCPLLIYGSAWEDDMDFSQFAIMFKSIYLEGFSRPLGGVRTIISILEEKIKSSGVDVLYGDGVSKILTENKKIVGIKTDKGKLIQCQKIFSSAGLPETYSMLNSEENQNKKSEIGNLSFTETIICLPKAPKEYGIDETILFYNDSNKYHYKKPKSLFDPRSAVICMPNNFKNTELDEGIIRVTNIANFDKWNSLEKETYKKAKEDVLQSSLNTLRGIFKNIPSEYLYSDVFTPKTIKKYTGHLNGTVYGSTTKSRRGETHISNLHIIGTDQGFLGIVGSILSGISMANLHSLSEQK